MVTSIFGPMAVSSCDTGQFRKISLTRPPIAGTVAKGGALQGYLVSKKAADKFGIKSLDDFKRPERVKKAFDANGDGKADLVACPPGWGCEKGITKHLEDYGLNDHIKQIKASYTVSMADALARFKNDESSCSIPGPRIGRCIS